MYRRRRRGVQAVVTEGNDGMLTIIWSYEVLRQRPRRLRERSPAALHAFAGAQSPRPLLPTDPPSNSSTLQRGFLHAQGVLLPTKPVRRSYSSVCLPPSLTSGVARIIQGSSASSSAWKPAIGKHRLSQAWHTMTRRSKLTLIPM